MFGFHISPFQVFCVDVMSSSRVPYEVACYKYNSERKLDRKKLNKTYISERTWEHTEAAYCLVVGGCSHAASLPASIT